MLVGGPDWKDFPSSRWQIRVSDRFSTDVLIFSNDAALRLLWDLWVNTMDKFLSRLDYIQTDKINPGKKSLTLTHLNIALDALHVYNF